MKKTMIQYVGRAVPRVDDVLKTDRVWDKVNAIVEVPEDQAGYYLQHPLEWREITPDEAFQRMQAKAEVDQLVLKIKREWSPMTIEDLEELKTDIDVRIEEIRQGRIEIASKPAAPVAQIDGAEALASDDEATRALGTQKIEAVARVLGTMDPKDKDQWTFRGPKLAVVTELAGQKVTTAEIKLALELKDIHRLDL